MASVPGANARQAGSRTGSAKPVSIPPWASLASGAASGLASCLLLQPMDLLKTRMQQERRGTQSGEERKRGGPQKRTQRLVRVARDVVHQDGWRGLWRGTVPTVARNVPGVAMYFYSVSEVRALLSRSHIPILSLPPSSTGISGLSLSNSSTGSTLARLTVVGNAVSGAVARVAVGFILSPITIVKARFESSNFSKQAYPSLTGAIAEIYRSDGYRGLFRGFSATALRDAPYAGLYMAIYEKTKDGLANVSVFQQQNGVRLSFDQARATSMVVSTSGLIAGTLATMLTHPFDIIKTRMQTMPQDGRHVDVTAVHTGANGAAAATAAAPRTLVGMMRHIAHTDGMGAYLDGLGLRCARKAASSAIGWTIFEGGRGLWLRYHHREQAKQASLSSTITASSS